ncbi:MAG: DUF4386 domain-containing protein [Aequorivita sp.]
MFLFLILLFFAEKLITSQIDTTSTKKITELSIDVIYIISAFLLAITLYQTLKPVNQKLALIALFWRLGETFTVVFMMIFSIEGKAHTVGFNISAILFSIGSLIFYYLFFQSKYIPQIISVFGIVASVLVTLVGLTILIYPDVSTVIQFGWIPMIIAEIATGVWLLLKGLKPRNAQYNPIN